MPTTNFYLYDKQATTKTYIIMHFRYDDKKLIYSTRQKVLPQNWDNKAKMVIGDNAQALNELLDTIASQANEIYNDCKINGLKCDNKVVKSRLDQFIHSRRKIASSESQANVSEKSVSFFEYFNQFIEQSQNQTRLQKNGKVIRKSTIRNYRMVRDHLVTFANKGFPLEIKIITGLSYDEVQEVKNYWKRFYIEFTNYLYNDCDNFDNAVGAKIRTVRAFFNYLKQEKNLNIGEFHSSFAIYNENIPVIALDPVQVQYLITDDKLGKRLSPKLKRIRDIFVFGCTVALRVSDLLSLTEENLEHKGDSIYLKVRSKKTRKDTMIKLPPYAAKSGESEQQNPVKVNTKKGVFRTV